MADIKGVRSVSLSDVGTSSFVVIDGNATPFGVSVAVYLSSGADLTYTVEHTLESVSANDSTDNVLPNVLLTSQTTSGESNYFVPIGGVRLKVVSHTSGTATMYVRQIGGRAI